MAVGTQGPGNRALATLGKLTPIQKIGLGAAALTLIAGTMVLTSSDSKTAMAAVYTDLEPRDASSVTDELVSRGVDYELADGGRTVMVPRDDVYDLRIALSGQGLPASNEGYALLDRQGITTSEFRQRIDFQRALEGELARTLGSIDGIDAASVHLALPEESVFVDEPVDPTASVLVHTTGTDMVTTDQVSAMVHLVASSVKGMKPENVTIADASGTVLSTGGEGVMGAGAGTGSRNDATETFERDMAASIRNMVARVAGVDNVAVTVQADLDLTAREATTESFDSANEDGGIVVAERTDIETYEGLDAAGQTGVLGPDGAPVIPVPAGNASTYTKDGAERTFAVDRTVESTTVAPGAVERISGAVLVDSATMDDEAVAAIETLVSTAAGIDLARGDQIAVTSLPFDRSGTEEAVAAAETEAAAVSAAEQSSMIRTGVVGLLILIAMLLAYRSTRRARREVSTPIDIGQIRAARLAGDPVALDTATAMIPEMSDLPEISAVDAASREALEHISELADRRPEEVAQILQTWLADETDAIR